MKTLCLHSIAICAVLLLAMTSAGGSYSDSGQRIELVSTRFAFAPQSISLKKGVPVVLVLSTSDVPHGLKIKELGVNVDIPKGKTVEVPLTPRVAGTFEGKCNHFCGFGHGRMTLTVNVTE